MIQVFINDLKRKPLYLWFIFVLLLLMFGNTFFSKKASDFIFALLSIFWFWVNKQFKVDGRVSVAAGLFFLASCPLFMLFKSALAERIGIWAFLLLLSGTILIFNDIKKE